MKILPLNLVRACALVVMALTPWLYGGTLDWVIDWVSTLLLSLSAFAIIAWALAGRMPRLGWVLPVSVALLALGWVAALNPRSSFDGMLMMLFPFEIPAWRGWLPSTVDQDISVGAMRRLTGLLGLLWIVRDMATSQKWRRVSLWALALTGLSVAAHGVMQKTGGDWLGYWGGRNLQQYVFAGFWYHGNAAAFLNLTWPFMAALTLESFARQRNHLKRALLLAGTFLMFAAILINVSKAGHLFFGLQAVLMMALVLPGFLRTVSGEENIRRHMIACSLLLFLVTAGLAFSFGMNKAMVRWSELDGNRIQNEGRFASAEFCLGELGRAGLTGFGPGSFGAVFLDVGTTNPEKVPGQRWVYAHQDALQTLMEWGFLGGGLWIALGLGLWGSTFRRMRELHQPYFSTRYAYQAAAFTSLTGVALHAQMDFPLQILGIQVIVVVVTGLGGQKLAGQGSPKIKRRRASKAQTI